MTDRPRPSLAERAALAMGGVNAGLGPLPAGAGVLDVPPPPAARAEPPAPAPAITVARLQGAGMIVDASARNRLAEEFAVVQDQVARTVHATAAEGGRHPRLVVVTSALPGEGKTFMALNIAAAMAGARGQPVLLVDADGKAGSLSSALGAGDAPGLAELCASPDQPVAPLVLGTERPRLSVLPFGKGRPSGHAMAAAALRVAESHPRHVVILDMPPALATSEPSALAPVAGQVVMVVEAERTQRAQVEAALDLMDSCPTIQMVLNRAGAPGTDRFGAYGYDG